MLKNKIMNNTVLFTIRCISNLHVGSGQSDDTAIDKIVQRDPISKFPCIHASSLKGAIREYLTNTLDAKDFLETKDTLEAKNRLLVTWFGSEKNEKENLKQGVLRFTDAQILLFPARGIEAPYYLTTSQNIIKHFNNANEDYEIPFELKLTNLNKTATAEGVQADLHTCNLFLNKEIVTMNHERTKAIVADNLPVIARNCLENGESVNLWYEEFVPRETIFYFYVVNFNMDEPDNNILLLDFIDKLNGKKLYIGANNTVGQGFSLISKIA